MNKLVWLRNDLRIHDNESFSRAFKSSKLKRVFAVYCICDTQWEQHDVAPARRLLVIRTLFSLQKKLSKKGISLLILDSENYDASAEQVNSLAKKLLCDEVFCSHDYPVNERRRDKLANQLLRTSNITLLGSHSSCLLPINTITKPDGDSYQVFTPFKNMFFKYISNHYNEKNAFPILAPDNWKQTIDKNEAQQHHIRSIEILEKYAAKYNAYSNICDAYLDNETKILSQLKTFCQSTINEYKALRDTPSILGTSQVSMYFSLGSLSIKTAYDMAKKHSSNEDGYQTWISELLWREFYRNIMAKNKRLSMGFTFKPAYQTIPWNSNQKYIHAWQKGMTGVPIVDAAMRQLNQTGWMHNRLRMVVAMFLTKYLLIDWRVGEKYFMQHLVDGDLAANNGGWQWSASTGTDAAPYFRVLSPVRQAERFDSNAIFIKKYVPELADYSAKDICSLNASAWVHSSYPQPIVDLKSSKKNTIELFKIYIASQQ